MEEDKLEPLWEPRGAYSSSNRCVKLSFTATGTYSVVFENCEAKNFFICEQAPQSASRGVQLVKRETGKTVYNTPVAYCELETTRYVRVFFMI